MSIIDFLQYKNEREEMEIERLLKRHHSIDEKLEEMLRYRALQVEDHKLFLAFLTHLEALQIDPQSIFKDAIRMSKFHFQHIYKMNWSQVVKLSVTFLTILRQNDPQSYAQFKAALVTS